MPGERERVHGRTGASIGRHDSLAKQASSPAGRSPRGAVGAWEDPPGGSADVSHARQPLNCSLRCLPLAARANVLLVAHVYRSHFSISYSSALHSPSPCRPSFACSIWIEVIPTNGNHGKGNCSWRALHSLLPALPWPVAHYRASSPSGVSECQSCSASPLSSRSTFHASSSFTTLIGSSQSAVRVTHSACLHC